jgi:hypothetical protein
MQEDGMLWQHPPLFIVGFVLRLSLFFLVLLSGDQSFLPSDEPFVLPSDEPSVLVPFDEPSFLPLDEPSVLLSYHLMSLHFLPSEEPSVFSLNE